MKCNEEVNAANRQEPDRADASPELSCKGSKLANAGNGEEPNRDFINERELLERIPISRRTLFNWREQGVIPSVKIGAGRVIFHWPSVQQALLRQQRGEQWKTAVSCAEAVPVNISAAVSEQISPPLAGSRPALEESF